MKTSISTMLIMIFILGSSYFILRFYRSMKYEKRLSSFALTKKEEESISFFDKIQHFFWKIIQIFSKINKKSVFLTNYAKRYEKYIAFTDRDIKEGIDYISLKFLFGFLVLFLYLLTQFIHTKPLPLILLILIFIISFFLPDIFLKIEFSKKKKRVEDDLLKAIIVMNNAFQSGRDIMQAVEVVKNELDGPIKDEFEKIYLDITYGLSLDVVFDRFYQRVKLEDAKYITSSLTLLNKTGGDIMKVFSMIEKSFLDKKNLKNELNSLTASSQFVFKFLIALPIFFILIIFVLNPTYFKPLYTTPIGILIIGIIVLLYSLYIVIVKKSLEVKF